MRAVVLSVAAAGAVVLAAWACLPDLEISPAAAFCGDGIIDPDAGEQCDPGPDAGPEGSVVGCSSCQVTCTSGVAGSQFTDDVSHHCYFAPQASAIIADASIVACEANSAHVVRFVSQGEVSLVEDHATSPPFWVGLGLQTGSAGSAWLPTEPTDEPGWGPGCGGCFANVAAGATQIPFDKAADKGFCVVGWTDDELWSQSPCDFLRSTICEREPLGTRVYTCPLGDCFTVAETQTMKSYFLIPSQRLGANDAIQACAQNGGELVVFQSREEHEQVGHVLAPLASDFWIGLATDPYGVWRWDGDAGGLEPLPWGEQQPTLDGGGRAYVQIQVGALDSELARAGSAADAGNEQHFAVCQL